MPQEKAKERCGKVEVEARVHAVFKLRLGGAEYADLREYAQAQNPPWGVSEGQLRRYMAAADELCKEYFDAKADYLLSRHLLQRRQLYAHAMTAGDYRTALAVLRDEAELESLYPEKKSKVDLSGTVNVGLTLEQAVEADRELERWQQTKQGQQPD